MSEIQADIASCDKEAIHLIGAVQPHGILLGFAPQNLHVHVASAGAGAALGLPVEAVGEKLDEILPAPARQRLSKVLQSPAWKKPPFRHFMFHAGEIGERAYDAYLYESEGLGMLELEPIEGELPDDFEIQERLNHFITKMKTAETVTEAANVLCIAFRELTGMDRVMMYRFLPRTWHGEVIAENRVASSHSFLSHRFPASDIPRPARDLYLRNRVRLISDAKAKPIDLTSARNPMTGKPVDLSDSRVRAVSPIHLEYLKNMGVGCSFSVAVVTQDKLWGLVACHHFERKLIPHRLRSACEILANVFASRVELADSLEEKAGRVAFENELKAFTRELKSTSQPLADFLKAHRKIENVFAAQGIAFLSKNQTDFAGLVLPKAQLVKLADILRARMTEENKTVFATDHLSELGEEWAPFKEQASGVLAVRVDHGSDGLLMIFRPEVVQTIQWGGDPRKNLQKRDYQGRLNPRLSFESWSETIEGHSAPWQDWEIDGIVHLRDLIFDVLIQKELRIQELHEKLARAKS